MPKKITYYDILGVSKEADEEALKKAYRVKAKELHPDINPNLKNATKKMILLNKAFDTLKDPDLRRLYDLRVEAVFNKNYQTHKTGSRPSNNSNTKNDTSKKTYNRSNENYNSQTDYSSKYKNSTSTPKRKWNIGQIIFFVLIGLGILSSLSKTNTNSKDVAPLSNDTHTLTINTPTPISTQTQYPIQNQQFQYPNVKSNVAPVPTVDCTGPDGKHLYVTQKECDDFNNAWKPTPTPIVGCGQNAYESFGYCYCNSGYQRNYNNGLCEKIVCPDNSHESYGSCICNDGYTKNYNSGQCDKLICPDNSHISYGTCACNDGYSKNYNTGQCDKIECPANSTLSYGYCSCNSGYIKNYSTGQCDKINQ